jgi:hypothetical protein
MQNDLLVVDENGVLQIRPHAGQIRALESVKQVIAIIAGTQSGKTSFGPLWLLSEIERMGQGDYLVVTPTFPLFRTKLRGEFLTLFSKYLNAGVYRGPPEFEFVFHPDWEQRTFKDRYNPHKETRVLFRHATNSEALESATVRAAWLDEAGQDAFKLGSYFAVRRRLSLAASLNPFENPWMRGIPGGRILITTTPYNLGWLKRKIHDPWLAANRNHPEYDVINFRSIDNPMFSRSEYERAKREMPQWQFDMMYNGLFTRPAGLIYDSFDTATDVITPFDLPDNWPRYVGVDFGAVNTAAIYYAQAPNDYLYAYRSYLAGGRTAGQHAAVIKQGEPEFAAAVGGAGAEDQWRREFADAGLTILRPQINDIEVGINRVYGLHRDRRIKVFETLEDYIEEKVTYSRKTDEMGQPTEKINDQHAFHLLDAERYILAGYLHPKFYRAKRGKKRRKAQTPLLWSSVTLDDLALPREFVD